MVSMVVVDGLTAHGEDTDQVDSMLKQIHGVEAMFLRVFGDLEEMVMHGQIHIGEGPIIMEE